MTIKEMNQRKEELGYSYEMIAALSGVPIDIVEKILKGMETTPHYDSIYALEKVLRPCEALGVREGLAIYGGKKQGDYTLEDYYALPDDERVELIDGVIYDMGAPTSIHQIIAGKLYTNLDNYMMKKRGECIPLISPIDVQLDCDDKTMVQPDVMVVCDREKLNKRVVYGAPDLIIEVLSPSTSKKDMGLKVSKYMNAGVREYWIVDSGKECIIAYRMNEEEYYSVSLYSFEDKIPVHIFEEECTIDFKEIKEYVQFLYEK